MCFTAASAPEDHHSLELHRKEKVGSYLVTSGRWLFCEIKHLESQLGWPKHEHKGPECLSAPLVKTCLDFWLPRAAVASLFRQPLFPAISSFATSFQTCSCRDLVDAAFIMNTI